MKSKKGGDTGCLKILAKKGCISYMDCCTSFTDSSLTCQGTIRVCIWMSLRERLEEFLYVSSAGLSVVM